MVRGFKSYPARQRYYMMYIPLRDQIWIHFFIGVGVALYYYLWIIEHKRERKWFVFGAGPFGEFPLWLKWYVMFCLPFEFITSLFYRHSGMFYVEIAYSPLEGLAAVFGMFVVDRVGPTIEWLMETW